MKRISSCANDSHVAQIIGVRAEQREFLGGAAAGAALTELRALGQGYLFSAPIPSDAVDEVLTAEPCLVRSRKGFIWEFRDDSPFGRASVGRW
jgi:hypothetical protein